MSMASETQTSLPSEAQDGGGFLAAPLGSLNMIATQSARGVLAQFSKLYKWRAQTGYLDQ